MHTTMTVYSARRWQRRVFMTRVLKFANSSFSKIVASIKVGEANARNAVKLLPSIAEQVGDISRFNSRAYLRARVTATEDSLSDTEGGTEFEKTEPSDPLEVAPENIAPIPASGNAAASLVDLSASIEIRKLRTKQHHETTVSLAQIVGSAGFKTFANPYDCLGYKGGTGGILLGVKATSRTPSMYVDEKSDEAIVCAGQRMNQEG
jgi:hypothetical protein